MVSDPSRHGLNSALRGSLPSRAATGAPAGLLLVGAAAAVLLAVLDPDAISSARSRTPAPWLRVAASSSCPR
jgi:hypothetical protein